MRAEMRVMGHDTYLTPGKDIFETCHCFIIPLIIQTRPSSSNAQGYQHCKITYFHFFRPKNNI